MKLKQITLRGFRGFNAECSIPLDRRLTLISAPNSHGKTSISEGFEWLLYGETSKVALADSKDEYRGSYRNIHMLEPEAPSVTVLMTDGTSTIELQALLSGKDAVLRVDGKIVPAWPFATELRKVPKPFILQHALKDLLLAAPGDRFTRFSALLGFDELTQIQKELMAFCTKPPLPESAQLLSADIDGLLGRVAADQYLGDISKALRKGLPDYGAACGLIEKCAGGLLPQKVAKTELLPGLIKLRDEAVASVFKGSVGLAPVSQSEASQLETDEADMITRAGRDALALVATLIAESAKHRILRHAQFYGLGAVLLKEDESQCPFCKRALTSAEADHVRSHIADLTQQATVASALERAQGELTDVLQELGRRMSEVYSRSVARAKGLLVIRDQQEQLSGVLKGDLDGHMAAIEAALGEVLTSREAFVAAGKTAREALNDLQVAIQQPVSDSHKLEVFSSALVQYVTAGRSFRAILRNHEQPLAAAQKALTEQLMQAAGMRTIGIVIELLENGRRIEKRMRVAAEVEGLKTLKSGVDAFVTKAMLDAISDELANDVMHWYRRIRTVGDPDVHFAGFDMKKTSQGGRVQIKASSYGRELVSAVSSLSESKLNALGLCISIAVNLKEESPFEFLIIDDPIQSWDADHEFQFITVVRDLVERGKQVVLLSHNAGWISQVRTQCADLNGLLYEITGYVESGPVIVPKPWVEPKQRLQAILAIVEDQTADTVRLQHAEEELRQVVHHYACTLHEIASGEAKSPANLDAAKVRKILTTGGLDLALVNSVISLFETVDDAHHSPADYVPNRQKIQQYYQVGVRLGNAIEAKKRERSAVMVTAAKAVGS